MKTVFGLAITVIIFPIVASAKMPYLQGFKGTYPSSKTASFSCKICHESVPKLNYYGIDLQKANHDFRAIEQLDSDGDGVKNIDEINKGTNPGDKKSTLH